MNSTDNTVGPPMGDTTKNVPSREYNAVYLVLSKNVPP